MRRGRPSAGTGDLTTAGEPVPLGLPGLPARPQAMRRPSRRIQVGSVVQILESLNLKQRRLETVSCPSCGRAQVDAYELADQVSAGPEGMDGAGTPSGVPAVTVS